MALSREIEVLELKGRIESKAEQEMTDAQRQYMLRQQLKAIQSELGEGDSETQEIRKRVTDATPARAGRATVALREVDRLERMTPGVARIPDDPHLSGLGARRSVGQDDRGSAGSCRGAPRPRRGSLRSRQGQRTDRRVPRGPEAAGNDPSREQARARRRRPTAPPCARSGRA